jgi:hypothetical protein
MSLSAKPDTFLSRHGDTIHQSQPVPAASELLPGTREKFIRSKSLDENPSPCMVNQPTCPLTYDTNEHKEIFYL